MTLQLATHGFPTPFACQVTRVSLRTLVNWSSRGFLKPSVREGSDGPQGARLYSFRDLVAIRVADELRSRGVEIRHLRGLIEHLRSREDLELGRDIPANRMLITDGHAFMNLDGFDGFIGSAEVRRPGQEPQALLLVRLGEIVGQLQQEARAHLAA